MRTCACFLALLLSFLTGCDSGDTGPDDGPGETRISEAARVLEQRELDGLTSISGDQSRLTFETDAVSDIREGEVLIAGVSTRTPDGLLRRVERVEIQGDELIVHTSTAFLDNVVETGRVSFSQNLSADDIERFIPLVPGATLLGGERVMGDGNPGVQFSHNFTSTLEVSGTVALDLTPGFDVDFDGLSVQELEFGATATAITSLATSVSGLYQNSLSVDIGQIIFRPFMFSIGFVPVVVRPIATVTVGASGRIGGGLSATAGYVATAREAVVWTDGDGWRHDPSFTGDPSFEIVPSAETAFRTSAQVRVELLVYGVAGPYVAPELFHEANVTLTGACVEWEGEAGLLLRTGLAVSHPFGDEPGGHDFDPFELAAVPLGGGSSGCDGGDDEPDVGNVVVEFMRRSTSTDNVCNTGTVGWPIIGGQFNYATPIPTGSNYALLLSRVHYRHYFLGGNWGEYAATFHTGQYNFEFGDWFDADLYTSRTSAKFMADGDYSEGTIHFEMCWFELFNPNPERFYNEFVASLDQARDLLSIYVMSEYAVYPGDNPVRNEITVDFSDIGDWE